jgi:hypothetical protein
MTKKKLPGIIAAVVCVIAITIVVTSCVSTAESANDELDQVQVAIRAAMADAGSDNVTWSIPSNNPHGLTNNWWAGEEDCIKVLGIDGTTWYDAHDYCYGPYRAAYFVETADTDPEHLGTITNGNPLIDGGWGSSIVWDAANNCWTGAR